MKKTLSMLLALVMLFSLCACSNSDTQTTDPSNSSQSTTNNTETSTGSTEKPTDGTEGTTGTSQTPTEEPTTPPTQSPTEGSTTPPTQSPTEGSTTPPMQSPTEEPTTPPTQTPSTEATSSKINFKDVAGIWYAEGHDDVSISFSITDNTWVFVQGENFNHHSCVIDMHRGTGGTDYYYDNGYFVSDCIKMNGTSSLVYTKGNNSITFYRQKNYPKEKLHAHEELLRAIDGYYWYLDGYDYTYIHPNVIPWYDHECLDWDSKNIYITSSSLVAYERFEPTNYWKYENELGASSTTHNTLLVNPIECGDSLISDFNMRVSSNKLYMTVGGTQYSFTRYTSPKSENITLKLGFTQATAKVGEHIFLPIEISPFWTYYQIEVAEDASDDFSVAYHDRWYTSGSYPYGSGSYSNNGKTTLIFYAQSAGERTFNIRIKGTQQNYQLKINVEPQPPTNVTGVAIDKSAIELERGKTETLTATVSPSNATNQTITWSSSDSSVAIVSSSGEVTAVGKGVATITATSADGGYTATCTVTVIDPPLTVRASIGVGYYMSDSASVRGVYSEAKASGGSENYVEYYVKVYYNGELVAEGAKNQIIVTLANGTYTAEVYVKDSNGSEATHTTEMTLSGY